MNKYFPLKVYLGGRAHQVTLTFSELDGLVGGLPPSARKYNAWWSNHDSSHSHCQSWNGAGYVASPDFSRGSVTFTRGQ